MRQGNRKMPITCRYFILFMFLAYDHCETFDKFHEVFY